MDNNSSDGTREVLDEAARAHPDCVRTAFEPRQGVSHGRNRGIGLSIAPVVAFTDDDVLAPPDWVQRIAVAMREHAEVACVGGRVLPVWTRPPPTWLTRDHWSPLALLDYGESPLYVDRDRPLCLLTANVAYRRSVLDRVGWFSPDFPRCQDHELLIRVWRARMKGLYLPSLEVACEVPAERLTWTYHRRWHSTRGRFLAQVPDDDLEGRPRVGRPRRTLFGSAAALYRQLGANAAAAVVHHLAGRRSEARRAEALVYHLAAFIAARARLWRREHRAVLPELAHFASGWVRVGRRPADRQAHRPSRRRM